jgi:hypothetical protein
LERGLEMPKKPRMARYCFNLCIERILQETGLGKNKKHIHADLKNDGLFDYSYVSFNKYYKEQKINFEYSNKLDFLSTKEKKIGEGIPREKEMTSEKSQNMVETEKRQDDEEKNLTNKYI